MMPGVVRAQGAEGEQSVPSQETLSALEAAFSDAIALQPESYRAAREALEQYVGTVQDILAKPDAFAQAPAGRIGGDLIAEYGDFAESLAVKVKSRDQVATAHSHLLQTPGTLSDCDKAYLNGLTAITWSIFGGPWAVVGTFAGATVNLLLECG